MKTKPSRTRTSPRGLSLIELLTVIAVIGIMVAIIAPNFGNFNSQSRDAVARRNAQQVASVLNVAFAAGADVPAGWSASTTGVQIIDQALIGLTPIGGAFAGKKFAAQNVENDLKPIAATFLSFDPDNKTVRYSQ